MLLDRAEQSTTDYTPHGLSVGQDQLTAVIADLGLDLETVTASRKSRRRDLHEKYGGIQVLRDEGSN
jgi:hypothetical protein